MVCGFTGLVIMFIFIHFLQFSVAVVLMSLRVLLGLLSGQMNDVQRLAGSPTLDEQIREENKETN